MSKRNKKGREHVWKIFDRKKAGAHGHVTLPLLLNKHTQVNANQVKLCNGLFLLFVGLARPYIYTVYGRIFGDSSAKSTGYTPYIWLWPTLLICDEGVLRYLVPKWLPLHVKCGERFSLPA